LPTTSTSPTLTAFSLPTGGNAVIGAGFGDNTLSEIAGGGGGALSNFITGGSTRKPVVVGGANQFKFTKFDASARKNMAGRAGGGVVGEAPSLDLFSNVPGFNFNTVPDGP
jgi:hypothetical protein